MSGVATLYSTASSRVGCGNTCLGCHVVVTVLGKSQTEAHARLAWRSRDIPLPVPAAPFTVGNSRNSRHSVVVRADGSNTEQGKLLMRFARATGPLRSLRLRLLRGGLVVIGSEVTSRSDWQRQAGQTEGERGGKRNIGSQRIYNTDPSCFCLRTSSRVQDS